MASALSDPFVMLSNMQQANAANKQAQLGQDWLDFAKQQFGVAQDRQKGIDATANTASKSMLGAQDTFSQWANQDRARQKSVFEPLQDNFIQKAQNWDSQGNLDKVAADARATATNAYAGQRDQTNRALASRGVRPDSGVYVGANRAADVQAALGTAGVENTARQNVRDQAMGYQAQAIGMGSNLGGQAASNLGAGVGAGSNAVGALSNANENFLNSVGIVNNGYQGAMTGQNNAANIYGNLASSQSNAVNTANQINSNNRNAIIGALGGAAGMAGGLAASKFLANK